MARIRYSDTAKIDIAAAITTIRKYFEDHELYELVEKHEGDFRTELQAKERILQENPKKRMTKS